MWDRFLLFLGVQEMIWAFLNLSDRQVLLPLELSKTKYMSFKLKRCLVNLAEVSLKINEFKLQRMGSTLEIKLFKY